MSKKLSSNSYVFMLVMVAMLIIIGVSLNLEYTASKLLPIIVSSGMFIAAAIGLKGELARKNHEETAKKTEAKEDERGERKADARKEWGGYVVHAAWLAGFFTSLYLLGFLVSTPLFILFYMKYLGSRWRAAMFSAVVTSAIIYLVFERAMEVDLYRGALFLSLFG